MNTDVLIAIAREAGSIIMNVYGEDDFSVETKNDDSPVTIADKLADEYICRELKKHFPNIPIISEESKYLEFTERKDWSECFIVDPLDGTKEFIKRNGDFTVNIAYAQNGKTVDGVVYAPVLDLLYYTNEGKAYREKNGNKQVLPLEQNDSRPFTIVASKSHLNQDTQDYVDNMRNKFPDLELKSIGSSLKFCLVAQGDADLYPRLGPTMEWDTAAAHAICNASGHEVVTFDQNKDLHYNKENFLNPFFLVRRR